MDVENVGILSQHCMAPQSRRTRFESSPPWKSQTLSESNCLADMWSV